MNTSQNPSCRHMLARKQKLSPLSPVPGMTKGAVIIYAPGQTSHWGAIILEEKNVYRM